jgi:hypothetical protein
MKSDLFKISVTPGHTRSRMNPFFTRLFLPMAGLWLALATAVPAAMLEGSQPKKWPANPARHVLTIKREAADAKQAGLIAAAEAAPADAEALKKAIGEGPAPKDASQWWYREDLGIRIPFAITGEAVTYHSALIEGYGKQELVRFIEPSSNLDYHATVAHHAEFTLDGKTHKDVDVVTLRLTFSEQFAATGTEGMNFEKQRTVVMDSAGKVLAISGDGVTEVAIIAI